MNCSKEKSRVIMNEKLGLGEVVNQMKVKIPLAIGIVSFFMIFSSITVSAAEEDYTKQQVIKKGKIINIRVKDGKKITSKDKKTESTHTKKTAEQKVTKAPGKKDEQTSSVFWVANSLSTIKQNLSNQNITDHHIKKGVSYQIQWGDTLSGLSQVTNIPLNKLIYENQVSHKDLIYENDLLHLKK